jgi:hypothetical protein
MEEFKAKHGHCVEPKIGTTRLLGSRTETFDERNEIVDSFDYAGVPVGIYQTINPYLSRESVDKLDRQMEHGHTNDVMSYGSVVFGCSIRGLITTRIGRGSNLGWRPNS